MQLKYLTDYKLSGRKVMLRVDFNVPLKDGHIVNEERIDRSLPTIQHILNEGASLIIVSHLGRPEETNEVQKEFSLKPIALSLEKKLKMPVDLKRDLSSIKQSSEDLLMLENIRFFKGEKSNDSNLAKDLASLCDIFVMDAFATAHRAHASTTAILDFVDQACAGLLIKQELQALDRIDNAEKPIVIVLGGAKISTKLSLINALLDKVDHLILGGGIANTCIAAQGLEIGKSLIESSMVSEVKSLINEDNVILPSRVLVAENKEAEAREVDIDSLTKNDAIFDVSPTFIHSLEKIFNEAATIVWNGPMGLFEQDQFSLGTQAVANLIARSEAYSIIGGGDTISAASMSGVLDSINYISTAGGALLEYLAGKSLPALAALQKKALERVDNGA
ncbi:MAG TPA: phosphoglycerate kinase [Gammaproteobacteria bacterium]|nr:phosphoglycerate kinase [Gammaproteobacteria bacterium]